MSVTKKRRNGVLDCLSYDQAIHQFILDQNGRYQLKTMYTDNDSAVLHLFPGLTLDLTEIFERRPGSRIV